MRVLIVEDEIIVARDLQNQLTRLGYQVLGVASQADAAIQLARRHKPDLVLMDVRLQGEMDGIEAASKITGGPKTILEQDLRNFKDIMEGTATAEEVQQRKSAAPLHTAGVVGFLTSGVGLATVGGGLLLWLLLRGGGGKGGDDVRKITGSKRGIRFTIEL